MSTSALITLQVLIAMSGALMGVYSWRLATDGRAEAAAVTAAASAFMLVESVLAIVFLIWIATRT